MRSTRPPRRQTRSTTWPKKLPAELADEIEALRVILETGTGKTADERAELLSSKEFLDANGEIVSWLASECNPLD